MPANQPPPRALRLAEYESLRSTIAVRGTVRLVLVPAVVVAWAVTSAALIDVSPLPIATVFPLAILVAGFEATYSLHTGVERLGRYIQVFFEETEHPEWDGATWETTAMAGGPAMPRGGVRFWPQKVRVVYGKPLCPEEVSRLSAKGHEDELVAFVRSAVEACQAEAQSWRDGTST